MKNKKQIIAEIQKGAELHKSGVWDNEIDPDASDFDRKEFYKDLEMKWRVVGFIEALRWILEMDGSKPYFSEGGTFSE